MMNKKISLLVTQGKGGYFEHFRKTSSKDNRIS